MNAQHIDTYDFGTLKKSTLGERLKFIRNFLMTRENPKDYTVTAIAKRLNVSHQSISAIERGESNNPSYHVLHRLTREYNVSLDVLSDEYYEGEEKLFAIGTNSNPVETDIDFDKFDDIQLYYLNSNSEDSSVSDNSFFETESRTGILLYEIIGRDLINPIFHKHLKSQMNEKEVVELVSQLIFDTEKYSDNNQSISPKHPYVQALEHISKDPKMLRSSKELIDLMLKIKRGDI